MFGIGGWELLFVAVAALLFIGPKRMPAIFRMLGRATAQLRKAVGELRESIELDPELKELPKAFDELNRPLLAPDPNRKRPQNGPKDGPPNNLKQGKKGKKGPDPRKKPPRRPPEQPREEPREEPQLERQPEAEMPGPSEDAAQPSPPEPASGQSEQPYDFNIPKDVPELRQDYSILEPPTDSYDFNIPKEVPELRALGREIEGADGPPPLIGRDDGPPMVGQSLGPSERAEFDGGDLSEPVDDQPIEVETTRGRRNRGSERGRLPGEGEA